MAVYGLEDAPWEWLLTIASNLRRVLIEVGILWLGAVPTRAQWLIRSLKARFTFGKWRGDEDSHSQGGPPDPRRPGE
eukprot:5901808-Pyramimonas_sp.AAC.1